MARNYWIQCPATATEGKPLDAWTARTRIQTNLESVYESALNYQTCILDAYELCSHRFTWYSGPHPIIMRKDRDGNWRTLSFSVLGCAGTAGTMRFRAILTDRYQRPISDGTTGPTGAEPNALFTFSGPSTTVAWASAAEIAVGSDMWWGPPQRTIPSDPEQGYYAVAWLTIWIVDAPQLPLYPRFAGWRYNETVDDE